jgi:16S rRNA (guanine527-N7)-methyltransferase
VNREREPLPTHVRDTPRLPAEYDAALRRGLGDLGLVLDDAARAAIDGHVRLLLAWTAAINLTAIRAPEAVALHHVVDSLAAVELLRRRRIDRLLDLGSGGGFPGVPLAAALPALHVTLLEPVTKKARFLTTAAEATHLAPRLTVMPARAESLAGDGHVRRRWPAASARAVASLADLIELTFPVLEAHGSLIAWKRGDIDDEIEAGRRAIDALGGGKLDIHEVQVDGLAEHRLVVATRTGSLPAGFPRDPAARRRRPW